MLRSDSCAYLLGSNERNNPALLFADLRSIATSVEQEIISEVPQFAIENFPNPFGSGIPSSSSTTIIQYKLPRSTPVRLRVFDLYQREVRTLVDAEQSGGSHSVTFDASSLPSGIYLCRLEAGKRAVTRVMLHVK